MNLPLAQRATAGVTSVVAFVVYCLTLPPSVTFWRPAELAGAASVLGIPEPPASALWLLAARVAQMILPGDAAASTALLSALCSALTAGLVVLIVASLVERWFDDERAIALPSIGGGLVAGLSFAWADSQWRAATVASTEPFAVLLVATALLLTLHWSARVGEPGHGRWLLAAALALGLLAGVDPRLLIVTPALGAIVFFATVRATPGSVVAGLAVAVVGGWLFDRLATAWLPAVLDGSNWFMILAVPVLLAAILTAWSRAGDEENGAVGFAAAACAMALLGATVVLVLPIRGASHPPTSAWASELDEPLAHAVGVDAASDVPFWPRRWSVDPERRRYQDRYGAWSPAALDDPMEASVGAELRFLWRYQIAHMYLRYLLWNYVGRTGDMPDAPPAWFSDEAIPLEAQLSPALGDVFPIRYFALPLALALIGLAIHARRDPRMAGALAMLFVLGGIGVVLAVSLQQPQPRDRDALYLVSFLAVAIWIGIAAAGLASRIPQGDDDEGAIDAGAIDAGAIGADATGAGATGAGAMSAGVGVVAILLCLAAGPVNMLVGGWSLHDRSAAVIAWDYAYNLLQSCAPNAILLTAGDNDTFPLLYLQDAAGVRRDVHVVNLRMANDPVYLRRVATRQRWTTPPLALPMTDSLARTAEEIDVEVGLAPTITIAADSSASADSAAPTMTWVLRGPAIGGEGMQMLRLQDRVIVDLLRANRWRRPVYFSASVPATDRAGLDEHLRREGLALRILPTRQDRRGGEAVDTALTRRALFDAIADGSVVDTVNRSFRLRGLDQAGGYLDPEERRIVSVYRHLFLLLAETEAAGDDRGERVREILAELERKIPSRVHPMPYWMHAGIASLAWRAGDREGAQTAARRAVDEVDALGQDWRRHPHARVYHPIQVKAQMLALLDDYERAIETYQSLQAKYPSDPHLRGQLEELRIGRHLARRDTAAALAEIDRIVAGYAGATDPALLNNKAAFGELGEELRGRAPGEDGDERP